MLRASCFFASALTIVTFTAPTATWAGPHHHPHQRPVVTAVSAATGSVALRHRQPVARVTLVASPIFVGFPGPFLPYYRPVRTIFVGGPSAEPPRSVTVTVNTFPTVVGIRRAPEAAPVIYRIEDSRTDRRMRQHERRRMAPSAGVHHVSPDTTTPRIIVVRGH
jgi:hypothetical protein